MEYHFPIEKVDPVVRVLLVLKMDGDICKYSDVQVSEWHSSPTGCVGKKINGREV